MKHSKQSQSRSSPAGRSGGPPQKRSPNAPMDEDEDTIADHGVELEASTGSKRMKSEIKVIDIFIYRIVVKLYLSTGFVY